MNVDKVIRLEAEPSEFRHPQSYKVYYVNGVKIGRFYMDWGMAESAYKAMLAAAPKPEEVK